MKYLHIKVFVILIILLAISVGAWLWIHENKMQTEKYSILHQVAKAQQLLLVIPHQDQVRRATLRFYEKNSKKIWQQVLPDISANLGKNGIGWDKNQVGFYKTKHDYLKKEGDNKTTLGIYRILKVFGFQKESPNTKMPYIHIVPSTQAVDDSSSQYYNRIVDAAKIKNKDWRSCEKMHQIPLYHLGLTIDQNIEQVPGNGSNIFIHIWRNPNAFTAGCIAMARKNIAQIINKLDQAKHPIVIIWPEKTYQKYQAALGLPQGKRI